ncbi:hypothetical protein [Pyxidicoccus xibeiensis]|uniref:hypothetical protein n=1 Tax=Pyxidicoccus xibeiensis TaxID=2906759 RepID=UPI0020A749B9|nr:hypothetical protein [Pyxidicoccus xibeiensis]MCP3138767.1 hypothetical protein [Pyxidicoccus xibeiensis]
MKRSLSGLVVALSLFACKEEPRGKMEPIPRPPGMKDTPAEGDATGAPARPTADPSKVVLRWKLAAGAPTAYRLYLERTSGAAPEAAAPEEEASPRGRKGRGKDKEEAPAEAPAPRASAVPGTLTYVMERTNSGDYRVRVIPEGSSAAEDHGTMSERGFMLDGLQGMTRNTATVVLELPRDPVGKGDTWALGTELVSPDLVGPAFMGPPPERRNRVKLTSLDAGEGGEQVAIVEYDLYEKYAGKMRPTRKSGPVPAREVEEAEDAENEARARGTSTAAAVDAGAEVKITGRGEFLVKAGRWRSWEGTLSAVTRGPFPTTAVQVPTGNFKLRLSELESPPAPQPTAKPQQ